jgi:hypothetical protein
LWCAGGDVFVRDEQPGGKKKQASPELTQEVSTTICSLNRMSTVPVSTIQAYQ